jgi:hypothetical protein
VGLEVGSSRIVLRRPIYGEIEGRLSEPGGIFFPDRGRRDNSLDRIDFGLVHMLRVMNIPHQSIRLSHTALVLARAVIRRCMPTDGTTRRKHSSLQGSFSAYGVLSSGPEGIRSTPSRSSISLKFYEGCNHENSSHASCKWNTLKVGMSQVDPPGHSSRLSQDSYDSPTVSSYY